MTAPVYYTEGATVVSTSFDPGSMSAPAFFDMIIETTSGETIPLHAMGKTAKRHQATRINAGDLLRVVYYRPNGLIDSFTVERRK